MFNRSKRTASRARLTAPARRAAAVLFEPVERRMLMSAAGTLDTTFGGNGVVDTTPNLTTGAEGDAVTVQSNGDLVVVGQRVPVGNRNTEDHYTGPDETVALRYLPSGALDPTFGDAGLVQNIGAQQANAVVQASDGKLLVAGSSGNNLYVTRLNADGSTDTTFGTGGATTIDFHSYEYADAMTVTSSGQILLAGSESGTGGTDMVVERLTADGAVDTTFGTAGHTFVDFAGGYDSAKAISVANNQIYLAGPATTAAGALDFGVARLSIDGTLDSTYGTGGKVMTALGTGNAAPARLVVKADGTAVLAGYATVPAPAGSTAKTITESALAQYTPAGKLDPTFGTGGTLVTSLTTGTGKAANQALTGLALRSDGSLAVGGYVFGLSEPSEQYVSSNDWMAADVSAAGTVTASRVLPFPEYGDVADNLTLDGSGKIVLVGSRDTADNQVGVARLNAADLSFDTSFGTVERYDLPYADATGVTYTHGAVFGNPGGVAGVTQAVAALSNGQVLAGGYALGGNAQPLVRLNADGTIDRSFVADDAAQNAQQIAVQPDGKILVVGLFQGVVRLNADGSLDTTFATNGVYATNYMDHPAEAVAVGPNGTIYVAGTQQTQTYDDPGSLYLTRLTSAGKLDTTFGSGGTVELGFDGYANTALVQANGDVVVVAAGELGGGNGTFAGGLAVRVTPAGAVDRAFGTNGEAASASTDQTWTTAALAPDGSVVFGGAIQPTVNDYPALLVGRLTPGGKADATFGTGGTFTTAAADATSGVAVDTDGTVLAAAGSFPATSATPNYPTPTELGVYRLTAAGRTDATFGNNGFAGVVDFVTTPSTEFNLALSTNHTLVVGVSQGDDGQGVARLNLGVTGTTPTPTTTKLTGTTFGTAGSYANDGDTIAKATDGNLSTFFDAPTASGAFVGIDLGSAKTVKQIGFAPRSRVRQPHGRRVLPGQQRRHLRPASRPCTRSGTAPPSGTLTWSPRSTTAAYRYWRYVGPAERVLQHRRVRAVRVDHGHAHEHQAGRHRVRHERVLRQQRQHDRQGERRQLVHVLRRHAEQHGHGRAGRGVGQDGDPARLRPPGRVREPHGRRHVPGQQHGRLLVRRRHPVHGRVRPTGGHADHRVGVGHDGVPLLPVRRAAGRALQRRRVPAAGLLTRPRRAGPTAGPPLANPGPRGPVPRYARHDRVARRPAERHHHRHRRLVPEPGPHDQQRRGPAAQHVLRRPDRERQLRRPGPGHPPATNPNRLRPPGRVRQPHGRRHVPGVDLGRLRHRPHHGLHRHR